MSRNHESRNSLTLNNLDRLFAKAAQQLIFISIFRPGEGLYGCKHFNICRVTKGKGSRHGTFFCDMLEILFSGIAQARAVTKY